MLNMSEDKQLNLNKLIFNGLAKLFEFPKRTCVRPTQSPRGKHCTILHKQFQPKVMCMQRRKKTWEKKLK